MRNCLPACLGGLVLACLPQLLSAAAPATLPALAVRLLPGTDPSILEDLEHVRRVSGAQAATLQFDLAHHRVLNATGRVVADAEASRDLQSVVDKWRYVLALEVLARAHPQEVRSDWNDGGPEAPPLPWANGTEASFAVLQVPAERQVLVFSMGPSGHLYFLPTSRLAPDMAVAHSWSMRPFGAETIVAITATDPAGITQIATWLKENSSSEGRRPGLIDTQGELLKQIASLRDVRIGLMVSYSCASRGECGP
jgi:hypothetical protein